MNATLENKTLTLAELKAQADESAKKNEDRNYKAKDLRFQNGHLITPDGPIAMTAGAAKQFAQRAGVPGGAFDYLLESFKEAKKVGKDYSEFTTVVQKAWDGFVADRRDSAGPMLVRLRHNGSTRVRAVLTDRYGLLDNHEYLGILQESLPAELMNARFSGIKNQLRLDENGLVCKLLLPAAFLKVDTGTDPHSLGLVLRNNEVGQGGIHSQTVFDRLFCTNQLRAGKGYSFRFNHSGSCRERVIENLSKNLLDAIRNAPAEFRAYWNTRDLRLENPAAALEALAPFVDLGKRTVAKVLEGDKLAAYVAEHGPTAFALVNSLTEFARDLEDREKAEQMELAAGKLASMSARQWAPYVEVSTARN